jgi:hypothetical protein
MIPQRPDVKSSHVGHDAMPREQSTETPEQPRPEPLLLHEAPRILRSQRFKMALAVAAMVALFGFLAWNSNDAEFRWFGLAFCGIFGGVGFLVAFVGAGPKRSYLRLTAEGFEFRNMLSLHTFAWKDVSALEARAYRTLNGRAFERVVFNLSKTYKGPEGRAFVGMVGADVMIPGTY